MLGGIQSRGRDATGYAYIREDGNTNFAKSPVEARDFLKIPGHLLFEPPKQMPTNMLLHARAATQGVPSDNKNNHPLYSKISGLCMIHNGWFLNDSEIREQFSLKPDAEVDTEVYLRLIEKFYIEGDVKSIETAIKEATKCVFGSVVCAMIQGGKSNIMWLWRDRGDLAVVKTEWGYVFASTMAILVNAIGCLNTFDLSYWELFPVPQSTLVKFEIGKKPKLLQLDPIEWTNNKYASNICTTTINGEEKIRRVKRITGGTTTYYYGNNFYDETYFNGYRSNKGLYLPGTTPPESGETNDRTPEAPDSKKPQRPQNHHIQCSCRTCIEWWEWQIEHNNVID